MNSGIRGLARGLLVLFLALLVYLAYLQTIASSELASREENARGALEESLAPRGTIRSSDGSVLAHSVRSSGDGSDNRGRPEYQRLYPQGSLTSHIVGYVSRRYSRTGIEASRNTVLSGIGGGRLFDRTLRELRPTAADRGRDITLTLDLSLQKAARSALASRRGAVVLLDVRDGSVIAMYSNPTFDPSAIDESFSALSKAKNAPLLSRASQGLYPPGSTMKIITAAAALESKVADSGSEFDGPKSLEVQGSRVTNYQDSTCGRQDLTTAFAKSCNTIFAFLGLEVGKDRMKKSATGFGFNRKPGLETPSSASRFPAGEGMDRVDLAWSAVGQAEVLATPLQMALVAAAVARDGRMPTPRLVASLEGVGSQIPSRVGRRAMPRAVAAKLQNMMIAVVDRGTGRAAGLRDVTVAGKTGTAEVDKGKSHAWFVGYAPAERPKYAVSVLIEHGGTGGSAAAPAAAKVLAAATKR